MYKEPDNEQQRAGRLRITMEPSAYERFMRIRQEYEEAMRRAGGELTMPASLYEKAAAQRAAEPAVHV